MNNLVIRFVISTVAATVCFLISLLFPVNCSYLNLLYLQLERGGAHGFRGSTTLENTISKP